MQTTKEEKTPSPEFLQEWLDQTQIPVTSLKANSGHITAAFVNSGAVFLGKEENNVWLDESVFRDPKNLPNALSSIISMLQNKARFIPSAFDHQLTTKNIEDLVWEFNRAPIFTLYSADRISRSYTDRNYTNLINDIISQYYGMSETDKTEIKKHLKSLAGSITNSDSTNYNNLFCQIIIKYDGNNTATIQVYYTTLKMGKGDRNPEVIPHQNYEIHRYIYQVRAEMIQINHKSFDRALEKIAVHKWIENTSTPQNPSIKLCF